MDLYDINSWPKAPRISQIGGIHSAFRDFETGRQSFAGTFGRVKQWNIKLVKDIQKMSAFQNKYLEINKSLGSLSKNISNGITSETQLNSIKSMVKNLSTFQESFGKYQDKINLVSKEYVIANRKLHTLLKNPSNSFGRNTTQFQIENAKNNVLEFEKTLKSFTRQREYLSKYGKIYPAAKNYFEGKIAGYKPPAAKAVDTQTGLFKGMFLSQGVSQALAITGQGLEQYGESRRQGGEILERQGLLTEGLKEFRKGSHVSAWGRGIGQVGGLAGTGAMIGMAGGPVGAGIGAGIGAVVGLGVGITSGIKDLREINLKKQEMQWGLARNNEKALTGWQDYFDDEYITDLIKSYRKRTPGTKGTIQEKISDLNSTISEDKSRAFEIESKLSDYKGLYGKDFENAPEEIFTEIGNLQAELVEITKNLQKSVKRSEAMTNELKAGAKFDTGMRLGDISSATNTNLFKALKGNTQYDVSTGHRTTLGYFDAEQSILAKEHSSISSELARAKKENDGSEYYRTLISQLENKLIENEKKQYQSGYNQDEMRSRMHKMRHGFTLFERDAGVANLINNQYATTDDYNKKISEIRGWNTSIDEEINKVLKMQDSEAKFARLNELNAEKSSNVTTINKLMGANKSDLSNLLRGMVGSSALTDNLGSFSRWAGQSNPMGRLLKDGNGLLQQILNVLKESSEQYSPRFQ